jgi:cell division protein FtsI/penicillin-binding protein 2
MDTAGYTPTRANIYDRNGQPLAAPTEVTAVGIQPDGLPQDEAGQEETDGRSRAQELRDQIFSILASVTGIPSDNLANKVENALPGEFIPLGEYPKDEIDRFGPAVYVLEGVVAADYSGRYYFGSGAAPHVVGYVGQVHTEQVGIPAGFLR